MNLPNRDREKAFARWGQPMHEAITRPPETAGEQRDGRGQWRRGWNRRSQRNAEIGDPKTISKHVEVIFEKTGLKRLYKSR